MDLEQRIRAARPELPDARPDEELLGRVMALPVARRRRPLAAPALALAALLAAAIVMLGGDRPDTAAALSQAMRWFDPPSGTVLHSVMVDAAGQTRESWQDVDDPTRMRIVEPGGNEIGDGAVYERATNTIYEDDGSRTPGKGPDTKARAAKRARAGASTEVEPAPSKRAHAGATTEVEPAPSKRAKPAESLPKGDPLVAKVRFLIADGRAAVRGREQRNGVDAWKITLTDTAERAPWVLWVRADDGKPLAIEDPGDPARNKRPERSRWTTYEVLQHSQAPLSLREAHPDARVVRDGVRFEALLGR